MKRNQDGETENKMNKGNLKDQIECVNETVKAKSDQTCCTDSSSSGNVTHDQKYIKKIGMGNPHPWSLIGMR